MASVISPPDGVAAVRQAAPLRADFYRLLSALFNGPATSATLAVLRTSEFRDAIRGFTSPATCGLLAVVLADSLDLDQLRYEYNNLFMVPGGQFVTPYESVYRGSRTEGGKEVLGLLNGPETLDVRDHYRRLQVEIDPRRRAPADFVGNELEFMHLLVARERDAWQRGDEEVAQVYLRHQRDFLLDHLARWLPELCARLAAATRQPLYRAVAAMTGELVAVEAATFAELTL